MKSNQRSERVKTTDKDEKKDKLIKITIVIITIIFIFIIYKVFNIVVLKNEEINLSGENYYQYFYGIRQEYSGDIKIVEEDSGAQLHLEDGRIVFLDSTPIYYKDVLGKALFVPQMELINTDTGNIYRLNEYTNVIEENNNIYLKKIKKDNKTIVANNSFLYDGDDLYLFLEETTITIGKKKYKLSPLSYAIVNYRQKVQFYDYDKDKYTVLDDKSVTKSDVIATNNNKDYKINMSVDSFNTDSSDQLLIKNINNLTQLDY